MVGTERQFPFNIIRINIEYLKESLALFYFDGTPDYHVHAAKERIGNSRH
jgi:hypothetical protein